MATVTLVTRDDDAVELPYWDEAVRFNLPRKRVLQQKKIRVRPPIAPGQKRIRVRPPIAPLAIQLADGRFARAGYVELASSEELDAFVASFQNRPQRAVSQSARNLIVSLAHPDIDVDYARTRLLDLPVQTRVALIET